MLVLRFSLLSVLALLWFACPAGRMSIMLGSPHGTGGTSPARAQTVPIAAGAPENRPVHLAGLPSPRATPSLRFVPVRGYRLGVLGEGWGPRALLGITLREGDIRRQIGIRATRSGAFLLGLNRVDPCTALFLTARDRAGRTAGLNTPLRQCPAPIRPPSPSVTVLRGELVP
jgi:hypothetical protein